MMQMKMGGLVLTGIGAYLIFSKGIQMIDRAVSKITEAQKWKAYYKACGEKNKDMKDILPPHYEITYHHPDGVEENVCPEGYNPEKEAKKEASQEALKASIKTAIDKTVNALFDARGAGKRGSVEAVEAIKGGIYVVNREDFYQESDYEKSFLIWYVQDDTLVDENSGEIIQDRKNLIGTEDIGYLFEEFVHKDPDIIYIQNDDLDACYEIDRVVSAFREKD